MKCNFKRPKLTKDDQQEMTSIKSTLPYIDRMQMEQRNREVIFDYGERKDGEK